jgi:hypothetical protein
MRTARSPVTSAAFGRNATATGSEVGVSVTDDFRG